jgi:hypothetical protein
MHGQPPDTVTTAALRTILADNSLFDNRKEWLEQLFAAVAANHNIADARVPFSELNDGDFSLADFLIRVAETVAIPFYNEGEYTVLSFDPPGISVCFDFEVAGPDFHVRYMRWSPGTGPHFERRSEARPPDVPPGPGTG